MKKIVLIALSISISNTCICQYSTNSSSVVPPSPTAEAFIRYGEIPVDYSTGVPNINIPLFKIEGRELDLPISISYHASGIKVNDIASEVGLGWVLNCGGFIARTVNGVRDEAKAGVRTFYTAEKLIDSLISVSQIFDPTSGNLQGIMDFEYFLKGQFENEDPMSDRYFYRLPNGVSGIFTYDYFHLNNDEDNVITLPYRPIKIRKIISGSNPSDFKIESFTIIDDMGLIYIFKPYLIDAPLTCSEWFLREMISANTLDTIRFNYEPQNAHPTLDAVSFIYQGDANNITTNCSPSDLSYSISQNISQLPQFNTPVLTSIVSSKTIVRFYYDNRDDFESLSRLKEITISPLSNQSVILKRIHFNEKYFGSTAEDKRLGLDNIIIDVPDNAESHKYSFVYEETPALPPYPRKMNVPLYEEDYWGYYNGNNSADNKEKLPRDFISNVYAKAFYGGNRDSDPTGYYAKACMLKEIDYPTGGKTIFEFERNYSDNLYPYKIYSSERGGYVGGFRVHSITNYNENNKIVSIKSFNYSGARFRGPQSEYFSYDQRFVEKSSLTSCGRSANFSRELVFSDPIVPLEVAPGLPIMYTEVIEYYGTETNNTGKIVYKYNEPYSPSPGISTIDNYPQHPYNFELPAYYHPYNYDKGDYEPELISKATYLFNEGIYTPVTKETYQYSKFFTKEFNTGIKLTRTESFYAPDYFGGYWGVLYMPDNYFYSLGSLVDRYIESVVAIDTKAYQEASLLTSECSYVYNQLNSNEYILTKKNYLYNEKNLRISELSTVTSKADSLKTKFKYPTDFIGTTVYDTMIARNIISPGICKSDFNNSKHILTDSTGYIIANNIPVPYVNQEINGSRVIRRVYFDYYDDYGNLLQSHKENDLITSYLWGYNNNYPIAEVINTNINYCAYQNFEEITSMRPYSSGNWTIQTGGYPLTGGKTGAYLFYCTSGTIIKSTNTLSPGKYRLSFYVEKSAPSGSYSLTCSGLSSSATITKTDWSLIDVEFTVTTATVLTATFTGVNIDDLRLCPSDAQMTTYTYEPLVGMTSATDDNNNTTYFEYDSFNRLKLIRDQDGNIIKKYDYHYQNQ